MSMAHFSAIDVLDAGSSSTASYSYRNTHLGNNFRFGIAEVLESRIGLAADQISLRLPGITFGGDVLPLYLKLWLSLTKMLRHQLLDLVYPATGILVPKVKGCPFGSVTRSLGRQFGSSVRLLRLPRSDVRAAPRSHLYE